MSIELIGSEQKCRQMFVHVYMHDVHVYWYALATEHRRLNAGWSVEVNTLVGCTSISVLFAVFIVVTVFVVAVFSRLFVWLLQIHEPTKHYQLTWQHCYVCRHKSRMTWWRKKQQQNTNVMLCERRVVVVITIVVTRQVVVAVVSCCCSVCRGARLWRLNNFLTLKRTTLNTRVHA